MKPKTKLQNEVLELSYYLPHIEKKMLDWGKVAVLKHIGYATKSRVICMDCGEKFSPELVSRKRATCPHCQQKLVIEESRKSTFEQRTYVASAQVVNDFQVIRNIEIRSYHKAGKSTRYYVMEMLQHWYLNEKKREVIAKNHTLNSYCDSWGGNMEIRKDYGRSYYSSSDKYDVYPEKYHPDSVFKPEFSKYGITHKLEELSFLEAVKILPHNPYAETLLKIKQYGLLATIRRGYGSKLRQHWSSIKICIRNKYYVKDASMWFDYLDLLSYFNKDLHNAHYVCPKDLKKQHDKLVAKKRNLQEKENAERKRIKAIQNESKFHELKKQFFGLVFSDKLIEVKVLESVNEFMEEGDEMHHCVFTNEYYLKPDSLVFSATIDGKRIETVEVSLRKMKVVQCYGKFNKNTEYHGQIVSLVNKNIKHIRKRTNQLKTA